VSGRSADRSLHFVAGMAATAGVAPVANASAVGPQNYSVLGWVHVDPSALNEAVDPPALVGPTSRVAFGVDGASGSALTVGLARDGSGAARFQLVVQGAGAATAVATSSAPVRSDRWYELAAGVFPGRDLAELTVTGYDGLHALPLTVTDTSWGRAFVPAAATGRLRLGSARPAAAAPAMPVRPWAGHVDEVYAIRGAQLSPDGRSPGLDLRKWITALPPFRVGSSPCP
jgi:hypothetical protein